jgi:hypothetical protein
MKESKISMLAVHAYNKIALPLCAGDAILGINDKRREFLPPQIKGSEA